MLFLIFGAYLLSLSSSVIIYEPAKDEVIRPNEYIVTMKKGVDTKTFAKNFKLTTVNGNGKQSVLSDSIKFMYDKVLNGFYVTLNHFDYDSLTEKDEVATISKNTAVRIHTLTPDLGPRPVVRQCPAEWGLARICQPTRLTRCDHPCYNYNSSAGGCATVYVIDTGIRVTHSEFEGRATFGANLIDDGVDDDLNGHGTHVAGTIVGKTYGVAKKAKVVAVKVADANGLSSAAHVIAGMDWVASNKPNDKMNIASISLGSGYSKPLNDAVEALSKRGVFTAVSAGNDYVDASNTSPASAPNAMTVGAIDRYDAMATFSNYGPNVKIFAPGDDIRSAWIGSDTATYTLSGTSMAASHVAGVAATLFCSDCSMSTPSDVANRILELSAKDKISATNMASPALPGNTANRLLQNGVKS